MKARVIVWVLAVLGACSHHAQQLELASWLSDHAVIQRDQPIVVLGFGEAGAMVAVELGSAARSTRIDADGRWRVELPAMEAGGPFVLRAHSGDEAILLEDILIGDVWIAGGQSNMEWRVNASNGVDEAVRASRSMDRVRFAKVPHVLLEEPAEIGRGRVGDWRVISPENVGSVSAVAFNFARELSSELDVPIGVFESNWGGSPIEAWIPREAYTGSDLLREVRDRTPWVSEEMNRQASAEAFVRVRDRSRDELESWTSGEGEGWRSIRVPGPWEAVIGPRDGVGWYVRDFEAGPNMVGRDGLLSLAMVDDYDRAYINGTLIGETGLDVPDAWQADRRYHVPEGVLRPGINTIAVQVIDTGGGGGIHGAAADVSLEVDDERVALAGEWRLRFEDQPPAADWAALRSRPAWQNLNRRYGGGMWNGMLEPHTPMGVRGAIWYQGEGNAGRHDEYRELFGAMIGAWRDAFSNPSMPIYAVQLASFKARVDEPSSGGWAWIRAAQAACREIDGSEMVLALDVGDAKDIHPREKATVGRRLAYAALTETYGIDRAYRGPRMMRVVFEGRQAIVEYDFADGLTTTDGEPPTGFAIAGADGRFVWADARLDRSGRVIATAPGIDQPAFLRYAWEDNPLINLVNGDGLPAEPFRTDDLPARR